MRAPSRGNPKSALWLAGLLLVAAGVATPNAAQARGFVSFGFGVPLAGPPAYYYPPPAYYPGPAYYPAPGYYAPPTYYVPPQADYYPSPPAYAAPPAAAVEEQAGRDQTCREYQSTTTIDGRPQASYGTACLQPDGAWRIVR
jgi:hypothetical protein